MKEGSREQQLREMREARLKRNSPNPFEDAARGRDPAPKNSGGGVESRHADNLKVDTGGVKVAPKTPVKRNATIVGVAPSPPEANSGSVSVGKGQEAHKQAPSLEKGSTPLLSITNSKVFHELLANQFTKSIAKKRGRPKKGEVRSKPWEDAGISKAQWYRNQKGK